MEVFLMTASNNRLCNFTAQQPISLFYIDIGALEVAPARPEWRRRPLGREAHRAAASGAPVARPSAGRPDLNMFYNLFCCCYDCVRVSEKKKNRSISWCDVLAHLYSVDSRIRHGLTGLEANYNVRKSRMRFAQLKG